MFVVSLTYKKDLSEVDQHIDAHVQYLEKYYAEKVFIASGRKVPRTGGVILANAPSLEALNVVLKEDPFYIAELADYEVTEFIPSMAADGFEFLKNFQ
ncbi:YciI family protein [Litoribacillus peritrichatus]|uniref:YciI family protein n=1 Tax=Litoribacillus peritrichatus TaxID=718191 RepID=A0ABP7N3L4_9GAMM